MRFIVTEARSKRVSGVLEISLRPREAPTCQLLSVTSRVVGMIVFGPVYMQ